MLGNSALTDGQGGAWRGMHWFAHLKEERVLGSFFFFNSLEKGNKTF